MWLQTCIGLPNSCCWLVWSSSLPFRQPSKGGACNPGIPKKLRELLEYHTCTITLQTALLFMELWTGPHGFSAAAVLTQHISLHLDHWTACGTAFVMQGGSVDPKLPYDSSNADHCQLTHTYDILYVLQHAGNWA